jgi:hypothetical protein
MDELVAATWLHNAKSIHLPFKLVLTKEESTNTGNAVKHFIDPLAYLKELSELLAGRRIQYLISIG